MDRLKRLGTWVLLVLAFFIFTDIIIYICIHNGSLKSSNTQNIQTVNEIKN